MENQNLRGILKFLQGAEQLKSTLRSAHTSTGRQESTAEHTWRLCLLLLLFEDDYPAIDFLKLLKIAIIHDLGEAISGDIPAIHQNGKNDKNIEERQDFLQLLQPLPKDLKDKLLELWDEYNQAKSKEAQLAKAFDKLETLLQHTQGLNPANFDYGFNLSYGEKYTSQDPLTKQLRRLIDEKTRQLAQENETL